MTNRHIIIQDLSSTTIEDLVDCFLRAFEGYFVALPGEVGYWASRFEASGVDYRMSYGAFDGDELIAFIIHCVGKEGENRVVFNTGTGVLPAYRGLKLVDRLYAHAIPILKEEGFTMARLEVIDQNIRAIGVYERVGFQIKRRMKCYQGFLPERAHAGVRIRLPTLEMLSTLERTTPPYSWDFTSQTLLRAGDQYAMYLVGMENEDDVIGHFILDQKKGVLAQLEVENDEWDVLFTAVRQLTQNIKINNIDACRTDLIAWLDNMGIDNVIDQFEMEMAL